MNQLKKLVRQEPSLSLGYVASIAGLLLQVIDGDPSVIDVGMSFVPLGIGGWVRGAERHDSAGINSADSTA